MDLAIFGAQAIALGVCRAIRGLYPPRTPRCFLVSQIRDNASVLDGIPVLEASAFAAGMSEAEKNRVEILIATPENVMDDIERILNQYGFQRYVRLTSMRWAELMGYYYVCEKRYIPLAALPVGCCRPQIHIFMAKFYKDRALTKPIQMPEWITPVQVGAVLCEERVADILDCEGDNISIKNGNYSELTALYWVWKNRLGKEAPGKGTEYFGLAHYRRILQLSENDLLRLTDNDVDVVLPYPMPYEPDIEEHHKRYLADEDWAALLTALSELQPVYAESFSQILKQQYLYNYNIILARGSVLADYCGWLFPILERVEQLSRPKGCERCDRYIGYMAESLETLYFMHNRDKLHIVHTGCRFLV